MLLDCTNSLLSPHICTLGSYKQQHSTKSISYFLSSAYTIYQSYSIMYDTDLGFFLNMHMPTCVLYENLDLNKFYISPLHRV